MSLPCLGCPFFLVVSPSFCGWAFLLWIWPPSRGLALPSQGLVLLGVWPFLLRCWPCQGLALLWASRVWPFLLWVWPFLLRFWPFLLGVWPFLVGVCLGVGPSFSDLFFWWFGPSCSGVQPFLEFTPKAFFLNQNFTQENMLLLLTSVKVNSGIACDAFTQKVARVTPRR